MSERNEARDEMVALLGQTWHEGFAKGAAAVRSALLALMAEQATRGYDVIPHGTLTAALDALCRVADEETPA